MAVVQEYFNSSFDAGTPAFSAFFSKFLGVRTKFNLKRWEMMLNDASPSQRSKLILAYQEQITELEKLREEMRGADAQRKFELMQEFEETARKNAEMQKDVLTTSITAQAKLREAELKARQDYNAQKVLPENVTAVIEGAQRAQGNNAQSASG